MLSEERLELGIERHIGPVGEEQVELDLSVARAIHP